MQQLPLAIQLPVRARLESFHAGTNAAITAELRGVLMSQQARMMYLAGGIGCGKTHLLQAACVWFSEQQWGYTQYIPLREYHNLGVELLEGIEQAPLICLDDIESIAGNTAWEQAVVRLVNDVMARNGKLIITGRDTPNHLDLLLLPDLRSRLLWGGVFHIVPLPPHEQAAVLVLRAQERGLQLTEDVARYLVNLGRGLSYWIAWLEELDRQSLIAKKKVSMSFVKQVLAQGKMA